MCARINQEKPLVCPFLFFLLIFSIHAFSLISRVFSCFPWFLAYFLVFLCAFLRIFLFSLISRVHIFLCSLISCVFSCVPLCFLAYFLMFLCAFLRPFLASFFGCWIISFDQLPPLMKYTTSATIVFTIATPSWGV